MGQETSGIDSTERERAANCSRGVLQNIVQAEYEKMHNSLQNKWPDIGGGIAYVP